MPVLQLIPSGDLALQSHTFTFIEGPQFVRQKLSARFQFFKGEWFLDERQGLPYYRDVLGQNPSEPNRLDIIRSLFRRVILTTAGVASVEQLKVSYEGVTRKLPVSFIARLKSGGIVQVAPGDEDFIVDFPS